MDDKLEGDKKKKLPNEPKKRRKKPKQDKPKYSTDDVEWNEMISSGSLYSRENLLRRMGLTESCHSAMLERGMPQLGDGKRTYYDATDVIQWLKSLGPGTVC